MHYIRKVNRNNIPIKLHHLIPLAEEWGIVDDGYCIVNVNKSSTDQLREFVQHFNDEIIDELVEWIYNPGLQESHTAEYHKFAALLMAFDHADSILQDT